MLDRSMKMRLSEGCDPQAPFARLVGSVAWAMSGRAAEAVADFRAAIRFAAACASAHRNLAKALAQQNKLDESLGEYEEALRLNPEDPEGNWQFGWVFERTRRTNQGIACYREALRLKPDYIPAQKAVHALEAKDNQ